MNKFQSLAYKVLTDEEKLALNLSFSQNKSTWEAGEIMGKAHYKYLEIHARGVKFFRLFTEYFTLFDDLFPRELLVNPEFRQYIHLLVIERKTMKEVLSAMKETDWVNTKTRNHQIEICMKALSRSDKKVQAEHLLNLIKDFDRWNNFRILPLSLQEPSAFKRRNKHKIKKLLSLNSHLHPVALQRIIKLYELKRADAAKKVLYLPIISVYDRNITSTIPVPSLAITDISKIPMFLFLHKEDADKYLEITSAYLFKENHSCRDGQIFWPELRYVIKKSSNYDAVMGVNPTRKAFLDNAGIDPEIRRFLKKKEAEANAYLDTHFKKRIKKAPNKR
jgi:hypothetical protein